MKYYIAQNDTCKLINVANKKNQKNISCMIPVQNRQNLPVVLSNTYLVKL
jgi:hypothetical protein